MFSIHQSAILNYQSKKSPALRGFSISHHLTACHRVVFAVGFEPVSVPARVSVQAVWLLAPVLVLDSVPVCSPLASVRPVSTVDESVPVAARRVYFLPVSEQELVCFPRVLQPEQVQVCLLQVSEPVPVLAQA
ncbi:MAG: hypothetical protein HKM22_00265 [Gammaproteobacteria bacterium]|nr:hypothetical protein [Gammaproteobacteria bacterium]